MCIAVFRLYTDSLLLEIKSTEYASVLIGWYSTAVLASIQQLWLASIRQLWLDGIWQL